MTSKRVLPFLALAGLGIAQPSVHDVRSAASLLAPTVPGYGIARGSLASISASTSGADATATFPLPGSAGLNGVSVQISSGGQNFDALMVSVSSSRVVVVIPSAVPAGPATLQVTDAIGATQVPVTIVDRDFGIFTQKAAFENTTTSAAQSYAMNLTSDGSAPGWNSLTKPAMPGQQVAILGTGTGASGQDETSSVSVEDVTGDFKLYIGGKLATINEIGHSGLGIDGLGLPAGLAGVDWITATIPAGVSGCRVSVAVVSDSTYASNFATIAVSPDGSTCSDPGGLSASDISGLPTSGNVRVGVVNITRTTITVSSPIGTIGLNTDNASASFQAYSVSDYISSGGGANFVSFGGCLVSYSSPDGSFVSDNVALPTLLDAGPAINLKGSKGFVTLRQSPTLNYSTATSSSSTSPLIPSQGQPFADPGPFSADNGSGGSDVGGFTANVTIPPTLVWTNQAAIGDVQRSQGVTLNWTGGSADGIVTIFGSSLGGGGKLSGLFICTERASVGTFTVPAAVTLALPASDPGTPSPIPGVGGGGNGILALATGSYAKFTASGLDVGVVSIESGAAKNLGYK